MRKFCLEVVGFAFILAGFIPGCGGKGDDTGTGTASSGGATSGGSSSATGSTGASTGSAATSGGSSTGGTSGGGGTSGSTSGGSSTGGSSTGGSGGSTGADLCPEGTCILFEGGPCEMPTGPVGNGCCKCGPDDLCSQFCRCAAPDTAIATPAGEVAIASLRPGDQVYSVDAAGEVVIVPVLKVSKVPAPAEHVVVRARLGNGRAVEMSPGHPTAEGRRFGALVVGDRLGDEEVVELRRVAYVHGFTHDILPDSASGAYFAAGALVGSTLAEPGARAGECGR